MHPGCNFFPHHGNAIISENCIAIASENCMCRFNLNISAIKITLLPLWHKLELLPSSEILSKLKLWSKQNKSWSKFREYCCRCCCFMQSFPHSLVQSSLTGLNCETFCLGNGSQHTYKLPNSPQIFWFDTGLKIQNMRGQGNVRAGLGKMKQGLKLVWIQLTFFKFNEITMQLKATQN